MRRAVLVLLPIACAARPAAPPAPAPASSEPEPVVVASAPAPEPPPTVAAPAEPPAEPAPAEPPAEPPPAEAAPLPSPAPVAPAVAPDARDPRLVAKKPRARALLVTELQALERLLQATPRSAPDRPALLRRVAESYVELEYSAARDTDGAKIVKAARQKAIQHYLALENDYPAYPKLDEVLYYAGYERERAGELAQARALYKKLEEKFPSSPFRARIPKKVLK